MESKKTMIFSKPDLASESAEMKLPETFPRNYSGGEMISEAPILQTTFNSMHPV